MNKFKIGDELICVENPKILELAKSQHECSPGGGWRKDMVFTVASIDPYEHDEVYWSTQGNGIWGRFAKYNSKFRDGDTISNNGSIIQVKGKLPIKEEDWTLVSRKQLI